MTFKVPVDETGAMLARARAQKAKKGVIQPSIGPLVQAGLVGESSADASAAAVQPSKKRRVVESHSGSGSIVATFPQGTSVFADPTSIEAGVSAVLFPGDFTHLSEAPLSGAADLSVQSTFKALQTTLYLRQKCSALSQKVGDLTESLSLEFQEKLVAERKAKESDAEHLKQVDLLNSELEKERQKVKDLIEQVQNVSMEMIVRTRGELMLEYKRGDHVRWDVDADIELFHLYYLQTEVGVDGSPAEHEGDSTSQAADFLVPSPPGATF